MERSRQPRFALAAVVIGLGLVFAAYVSAWVTGGGFPAGIWLMVAGVALVLPGTILLGGLRGGRASRPLLLATAFLLLVLAAGLGAALLLPPETVDGPLLLGVPRRAAIILFGIGIAPSLVLPLAYALDFDRALLGPESLAALRDECERLRDQTSSRTGE
ncbi:MAG: hypothetical protein V4503_11600 [Gemmatimonadota bacterium]